MLVAHDWGGPISDAPSRFYVGAPRTYWCVRCEEYVDEATACPRGTPGIELGPPTSAPVDSGATEDAKGPQISDGEVRITAESGGQKGQKLARFDLIPGDVLWEVAELYGAGAEKYDERNWERGYPLSLSFAALQRHAWKFWNGEDDDPETGRSHMAAVIFHAAALMRGARSKPEYDDRPPC